MNEKDLIVCVSGGFDILHSGHVRMLLGARHFGKVVVILNSDKWLLKRKGFIMSDWQNRKEVLLGIRGVDQVVSVDDSDGTVCDALEKIKPHVFANGGLRTKETTPERMYVKSLTLEWFGDSAAEKKRHIRKRYIITLLVSVKD